MSLPAGPASLPAARACLIVLDGWGLAPAGPGNAVSLAHTPVFDELWGSYPHTTLTACGRAVGLPEGQMGNSEVGHLNLGAGAVVRQDLVRIDDAIADGSLAQSEVLRAAFADAGRVHLLGLVSDGGVHSSLDHLRALIALGHELAVKDLVVHAFTDGRDTLPHSGAGFLRELDRQPSRARRLGDRPLLGDGPRPPLGAHAARLRHARRGAGAAPRRRRRAGGRRRLPARRDGRVHRADARRARTRGSAPTDSVIAFNFRPDRMRQMTRALAEPGFGESGEELPGWRGRDGAGPISRYTTLTRYEEGWPYPVVFSPERPATTLSVVLEQAGAAQLHVAETEKYAHVTYFFNGGEEAPLAGERREMVPSPRDVPTYDHKPQMSARAGRGARSSMRGAGGGARPSLRDHQLRQRRHGRAHRRDPGGRAGDRDGRRLPRRGRHGGARERRRVRRDCRPRQRRPHARARRQPQHGALDEPRAADRHERRRASCASSRASSPMSPRRVLELLGIAQPAAMSGHSLIGER